MTREEILKTAKPILFNTGMVKAILGGEKTVTRRVAKKIPKETHMLDDNDNESILCRWGGYMPDVPGFKDGYTIVKLPYQPGNILYVRETWQYAYDIDDSTDQIIEGTGRYYYCADADMPFSHWVNADGGYKDRMPWKPSIHMPKKAARIFLKVTDVRVERLQDITYEQVIAEGVKSKNGKKIAIGRTAIDRFKKIWDSNIKKQDIDTYGWNANPWVWVIEFERMEIEQ